MTEYIYNIIKVLSDFNFRAWDYIKDNGLQVTSAARSYYCTALGKLNVSDNEAKEIARFIAYKYQDKCKSFLWDSLITLREGQQVLEVELDGVRLGFSVNIQCNSIKISQDYPFKSKLSIYEEDLNTSYLIQTVTGKIPNDTAKEKVLRGITILLERQ